MYNGPRHTVKVPRETLDSIRLLSTVLGLRQWQIIDRALVLLRNKYNVDVEKFVAQRRWGENQTSIRERLEMEREAPRCHGTCPTRSR